jgi:hypothetical protein
LNYLCATNQILKAIALAIILYATLGKVMGFQPPLVSLDTFLGMSLIKPWLKDSKSLPEEFNCQITKIIPDHVVGAYCVCALLTLVYLHMLLYLNTHAGFF